MGMRYNFKHNNFCCDEITDVFCEGAITFNPDHEGDTRDLVIVGQFKEGNKNIPDSSGIDYFKIIFCPFCGEKL